MRAYKVILAVAHVLNFCHFQRRFYSRKDGRSQDKEEAVECQQKQEAKVTFLHFEKARPVSGAAHDLCPIPV